MAQVTYGDFAIDMRQEDDYGIADVQALGAFLDSFEPTGEQELIHTNTMYRVKLWDAAGHTVIETWQGNFQSYYVSSMQMSANGMAMETVGDFYIDPYTLDMSGTLTGASLGYVAGNALIGSLSGVSLYFDSLYNDTYSGLTDASMFAGDDTISSGSGDDYLLGYAGNDSIQGGGGNDTLDGGAGNDTMAGGVGDDTYIVDSAGDVVTEYAGEGVDTVMANVSYHLGAHLEKLKLTGNAPAYGTGNDGNNVITGNAGNNTLDGAGGNDTLKGGKGDDTYIFDGVDTITELKGEGTDTVHSSVSYTLGANLENLILAGTASIKGTGNALGNWIVGNDATNLLDGRAGQDTLEGGRGNDTYIVDNVNDKVVESTGQGKDTVKASTDYLLAPNVEYLVLIGNTDLTGNGNELANEITGNGGANLLRGNAGKDALFGMAGADTLLGGNGSDTLNGGTGNDSMAGNSGNDLYVVDSVDDVVNETPSGGTDTVKAWVSYHLGTNVENLVLNGTATLDGTGNPLANRIVGNSAANVLAGNGGNDTLIGGGGMDTLIGGKGADSFVFDTAFTAGVDSVTDYQPGVDSLVLDDAVFAAIGPLGSITVDDGRFYAEAGATAGHDADDRVIYDTATGALYYDPDGSGAAASIQFAQMGLASHPALAATDIVVV